MHAELFTASNAYLSFPQQSCFTPQLLASILLVSFALELRLMLNYIAHTALVE